MQQRIEIPAERSRLGDARAFIEAAAARSGFDATARYQITMAGNEAVSNAIEHGAPCTGGTLELTVAEENGEFTLYVRDCGDFPVAGTPAPDPIAERGRGFAFMNLLMDDVRLEARAGATTVRLAKRTGAAAPADAAADKRVAGRNRAVVARVIEAFRRRDEGLLLRDVDLGVMFEPLSTPVRARTPYLGRAGLHRYLAELNETWDEFDIDVTELRTRADYVVALGHVRARHGDVELGSEAALVWRIRDEKVVWGKTYATYAEGLEAAGLDGGRHPGYG